MKSKVEPCRRVCCWVGCLLALGILVLPGCAFWSRGTGAQGSVAGAAAELVDGIEAFAEAGKITWAGIRDGEGRRTPATRVLDEHIVSALLLKEVPLTLADSLEKWDGEGGVPARLWQDGENPRVLAARVEEVGSWAYLRLFLVEGGSGRLLATRSSRLAQRPLQDLAALKNRREGEAAVEAGVEVELHLLGMREEGGIAHLVEIEEQGTLQSGDRLQVRFRVATDCQVYAFLYSSEGERRDVFGSQFVYSGRWQYGPGQETWIDLGEADKVYSLYFLAGRRLPEELADLWERMYEPVEQGRVNRFDGLDLLDQIMSEFLLRNLEQGAMLQVQRGSEGVRMGKEEKFILEDGTPIVSRAELLRGEPVLVRVISFAVR